MAHRSSESRPVQGQYMMNTRKMLVVVLCLGAFGAACAKRPAQSTVASNRTNIASAPAAAARPAAAAEALPPRALTEDEVFAGKSLAELNAERPMADVFFDYDSFELRPEGREALQRN